MDELKHISVRLPSSILEKIDALEGRNRADKLRLALIDYFNGAHIENITAHNENTGIFVTIERHEEVVLKLDKIEARLDNLEGRVILEDGGIDYGGGTKPSYYHKQRLRQPGRSSDSSAETEII